MFWERLCKIHKEVQNDTKRNLKKVLLASKLAKEYEQEASVAQVKRFMATRLKTHKVAQAYREQGDAE